MGRVVRYSQMATKPRSFDPNFYYHVYNCGVEKRRTFLNERDYQRFWVRRSTIFTIRVFLTSNSKNSTRER